MNLTRVEPGDQRKLLYMLDLIIFQVQHIYSDRSTYLKKYGKMLMSLTDRDDIHDKLASK